MKNRKSIGILTVPNDPHALMVSATLREMGHNPVRLFLQNYPQITPCSFRIGTGKFEHSFDGECPQFDTLWIRRPHKSVISKDLHEADRQFFEKEASMVEMANISLFSGNTFAVNPMVAINTAENKILQLQRAVSIGFTIPETLISNNPDEVRSFIRRLDVPGCIYKSILPHSFLSWNERKSVRTASVSLDQLPSDTMLRSGGGIYQAKIKKKYEIRATIFGRFIAAAKLHSQLHTDGKEDWRNIPAGELIVEPHDLPKEIQEKCFSLLDSLGLVMGCFDIIVTPDNEYVFLEVNQQGQFLWVEQFCPEIRLLETFCHFLTTFDKNFHLHPNFAYNNGLSFRAIEQSDWFRNERVTENSAPQMPIPHKYLTEREPK